MNHGITLIVGPEPELESAFKALEEALRTACSSVGGLCEYRGVDERSEETHYVFGDALDNNWKATLAVSSFLPGMYIAIDAKSLTTVQDIERNVRRSLPVVTEDELLTDASRGTPESLRRLGLGSSPHREVAETATVLEAALISGSAEERGAATFAMFVLYWGRFAEPLRSALSKEEDPAVARTMEAALLRVENEGSLPGVS